MQQEEWRIVTRAELAALDDAWPLIRVHLANALDDAIDQVSQLSWHSLDLEVKYRRGNVEHGNAWVAMSDADLLAEMREELADLVIYAAMRRVLNTIDRSTT